MQGLELCENFFREYGEPMLREIVPELWPQIAVGLFGSGSECYGYDDEISRDHDFEPGFMIFLPGEERIDRRTAFLLERAYAKLPGEYAGVPRSRVAPVGGNRHGVLRLPDFLLERLGTPDGNLTAEELIRLPENYLAEFTNGKLFHDGTGVLTSLRARYAQYPEDIRCKKLAGHLLLAAQAGQYNYARCLAHGEEEGAQLAVFAYCDHMTEAVFLLNRRYRPYYKWSYRALRACSVLAEFAEIFSFLLTTPNDSRTAREKGGIIEDTAGMLIAALQNEGLTEAVCTDLEKHAYSVNDSIEEAALRNRHILYAV